MDPALQSPESFTAHVERVAQVIETRAAESGEAAVISRETVREAIRSLEEQDTATTVLAPDPLVTAVPATGPTTQTIEVLPEYLRAEGADADTQHEVEALVTETFHSGLFTALRHAKSKRPIVEDAFHDALVDIVVPILKERHRL